MTVLPTAIVAGEQSVRHEQRPVGQHVQTPLTAVQIRPVLPVTVGLALRSTAVVRFNTTVGSCCWICTSTRLA